MSSVFNWVLEPPLELIVKPSSESEQFPYYSPPRHYAFTDGKGIREMGRPSEVPNTIYQTLRGYIPRLIATLLGRENICSVEIYNDSLYGAVALIKIDLPAKDALELWLKLIDYLPYEEYKIVLSLRWLGENNVSEDELVNYIVKIMIKSKIGPKALPGFDATRMVQEARE
jgi:hypothetical protein